MSCPFPCSVGEIEEERRGARHGVLQRAAPAQSAPPPRVAQVRAAPGGPGVRLQQRDHVRGLCGRGQGLYRAVCEGRAGRQPDAGTWTIL